jgi:NADP-dependent aldehyde dehydrogenase
MMTAEPDTTLDQLDRVLDDALAAAQDWADLSPSLRAARLAEVADALDDHAAELVPVAEAESHLATTRLAGEVLRTTWQLRMFAEVLRDGSYLGAVIDHADPGWPAGPRSDLRRMLIPVGPVVVFGASNFPFAFSVAGGDTASALAAGCPVVHKAHPGHPRLAALTGRVLTEVLGRGVFALIHGEEAGRRAVTDPRVRAGAFTGSLHAGRALFDLASSRPEPIPFYAEMGSLNPVFVTSAALAVRRQDIVAGYVASFTLGAGQFCTKPGLLLVPDETVAEDVRSALAAVPASPLLNDRIATGFAGGVSSLREVPGVHTVVAGAGEDGSASPTLLTVTAADLLAHAGELLTECFGPVSIVATYADEAELMAVAAALDGQLTATVHAEPAEKAAGALLAVLRDRSGRLLWNQWPTGVSVTWAMQHGGPYPATTSAGHTSVGAAAVSRFLRPVAYQAVPDPLLPPALQEANPLRLPRRVDGQLVQAPPG